MPISRPRLVALDTSHLVGLVNDWISGVAERRQAAQSFVPRLIEQGWLPLLCWSHLEELLLHHKDDLVDARLRYLWSWPQVAWIRPSDVNVGLGSVLDILAAEAMAAHGAPTATLQQVSEIAREGLVSYGAATDALPDGLRDWRLVRGALEQKQARAREIAAIAPWRASETLDKERIGDLIRGAFRAPEETARILQHLHGGLTNEIATRGDKRIPDAQAVAGEFFEGVLRAGQAAAAGGAAHPGLQILLAEGVDMSEVDPNSTFGEVIDRHVFLKRMRIALERCGLPFEKVKKTVTKERIPVWMIQHSLRLYGHDQPERKGSDLNDAVLLSLAPYADLTLVDKRTLESLRRVRLKVPALDTLVGDVRKASSHQDISSVIAGL